MSNFVRISNTKIIKVSYLPSYSKNRKVDRFFCDTVYTYNTFSYRPILLTSHFQTAASFHLITYLFVTRFHPLAPIGIKFGRISPSSLPAIQHVAPAGRKKLKIAPHLRLRIAHDLLCVKLSCMSSQSVL